MSQLGDKLKQLFLQGQGVETQAAGVYNPGVEVFNKRGINTGTDIGVPTGTPITLPKGNYRVEQAFGGAKGPGYIGNNTNSGYGNSVLVRDTNTGDAFRFSHLLKPLVQQGQQLSGGLIGYSGATGNVTGPHVDIEALGKGVGNLIQSAVAGVKSQPKLNLGTLLSQVKARYGQNIVGVSNDPNKLIAAARKTGGKVIKVQL